MKRNVGPTIGHPTRWNHALEKRYPVGMKGRSVILGLLILALGSACDTTLRDQSRITMTDSKGRRFVFLKDFQMQGRAVGLGLETGTGKWQKLGMTGAEWYMKPPAMVRPATAVAVSPDGLDALYACSDHAVLGSWGDLVMFLYDSELNKFYSTGQLYDQSPFSCIGKDDALNPVDVNSWETVISTPVKGAPWKVESIRQGLKHPNVGVRSLTRRWLSMAQGKKFRA